MDLSPLDPNQGYESARDLIRTFHNTYVEMTTMNVKLDYARERAWYEFTRRFTLDDLKSVICNKWKEIRQGKATLRHLLFHNLVENLDWFEEDLAMFTAQRRSQKYPPGKASVLRATGRQDEPKQEDAKSAKQVMEERKKLAQMLGQWNKEQKGGK